MKDILRCHFPLAPQSLLGKRLLRGGAGTLALLVVSTGLGLTASVLLARLLGAANYGVYAYVMAWINVLAVFTTLGFNQLVVREAAVYKEYADWGRLRGLMHIANGTAIMLSLSLALMAALVAGLSTDGVRSMTLVSFWLALMLLPLMALTQIRQAVLHGLNHVLWGKLPESLIRPGIFVAALGVAYVASRTINVHEAILAQVLATLVAFAIGAWWLTRNTPQAVKTATPVRETRQWIRLALPFVAIAGIHTFNTSTDTIMLGLLRAKSETGIYFVANQAAGLIAFTLAAANAALSPVIAGSHARSEVAKLQRAVTKGVRLSFALSLFPAIAFLVFGETLLGYFGAEFRAGHVALLILTAGQLVNVACGSLGPLLNMTGYQREVAVGIGVSAVLNVLLNAVLIPLYGMLGAAAATATSLTIWNVLLAWRVRNRLDINPTLFARTVRP